MWPDRVPNPGPLKFSYYTILQTFAVTVLPFGTRTRMTFLEVIKLFSCSTR